MIQSKEKSKSAIKAAFPHTIPVLTGYVVMGMAFGVLLSSKGFGFLWAMLMGIVMYAGSMQFVAVSLLAAGFDPLGAFLMTLMVNARHVFYGIPLLERFKEYGKSKFYMIFALTDETFALLCATKPPKDVDEKKFYLSISVLDHLYWITGCTLGGILGGAVNIDTHGIDFVMTALFIVIFLEQWKEKQNRSPALIGLFVSLVCRILFGPQWFILAAMAVLVVVFVMCKKPLSKKMEENAWKQ